MKPEAAHCFRQPVSKCEDRLIQIVLFCVLQKGLSQHRFVSPGHRGFFLVVLEASVIDNQAQTSYQPSVALLKA